MSAQAGDRGLRAHDSPQLGVHPLARDPGQAGARCSRRGERSPRRPQAQLAGEPRHAQDAQRVVVERARRHHAQAPCLQVARPAEGVDERRRPPAARPWRSP